MRKIILAVILVSLLIIPGYTQLIKPVKIDSLITVSLPLAYQEKDTLGQQRFTGNASYGYMIVIRSANDKNNAPLKKERDLNKVLNNYIANIKAQSPGSSIIHLRDTIASTLKAKTFTLKNDDGSGNVQLIDFTLIYTQDATYTFEYEYPGMRSELIKDEYKSFISSIRMSPQLQRNDQYLSNNNGLSPGAKIGIFGGGALLAGLAIVLILRRKKLAV
jgi:hypothetical protein